MSQKKTDLAVNLARLLEEKGWSGLQLSYEARIGQARVSDILLGKTIDPRIKTVQRIAGALGVSVDDLLQPVDVD